MKNKKIEYLFQRLKLRLKLFYYRLRKLLINDYNEISFRASKFKLGKINLKNPESFTEKLLYLKLFYRNPLQTLCADKYYVREYVKLCGFENILKKNYIVTSNINEINYEKLPQKCFLKCNHWSGFNFYVDKINKGATSSVISF